MTTYPAASDYFKAVQAPAQAFTVEKLRKAEFARDMLGPIVARGTSAVVFQATVDRTQQAVRCYVRSDASSRERYGALGAYLADHDLKPYVEGATWLDEAIRVNGNAWPVLTMDWIDGRTLNEYVNFLVDNDNTAALSTLARRWRELVALMQGVEFAHCDLQHGNIMVDQECRLRLVDYDGIWIPQLAAMPAPTESGHPNYQHPGRQDGWGRWFDTFSALVIYLSLVALGRSPRLWAELYNSKNLLFCKDDFVAPFDTQAWRLLTALGDPEVDTLARQLRRCCDPGWVSNQSLEMTLDAQPRPAPGPVPAPKPKLEDRWWEMKPAAAPERPSVQVPPQPGPAVAGNAGSAPPVLPAPPPLSAPLGETGLTKPRPVVRPATSAQSSWWAAQGPSGAARGTAGSAGSAQPAPPPPVKPTRQQQQQVAGSIALAVGIIFTIAGALGAWFLLIIGLPAAAWGVWRLISLSGKNTSPPGQPPAAR